MVNQLLHTKINLQDRTQWHLLPRDLNQYPPPPCAIDGNSRTLARWIYGLGPIETSDIQQITRAVDRMLDTNVSAPYDSSQWVAVDGPSHIGKTYAVVVTMLRLHDTLLGTESPPPVDREHAEHIPVIYVADQGASEKTLLQSIATAAGVPYSAGESTSVLRHRLRLTLPRIGCRLIVVDEAHMLRRVGAARDLTDNLRKELSLPVSFLFCGAGLRESALYRRTDVPARPAQTALRRKKVSDGIDDLAAIGDDAAMQLRNRMKAVQLLPFSGGLTKEQRAWANRMNRLIKHLESIDGLDCTELRSESFTTQLFNYASGRTGTSFTLIKDACAAAIYDHRSPTLDDLHNEFKRGTLT